MPAWRASAERLAEWVKIRGRLPQPDGGDAEEVTLARFLVAQRRPARNGFIKLHAEKRRLLTQVPGCEAQLREWEDAASGQAPAPEEFETRVEELRVWVVANDGLLPGREDADVQERRLSSFLGEQRRRCRAGSLPAARRASLERLGPAMQERLARWDKGNLGTFWVRVDVLEAWVRANGAGLPQQRSADAEEAGLARFLNKLQKGWAKLPADRRARLGQVPHMAQRLQRWEVCRVKPFLERVAELQAWVAGNGGRLPRREGPDDEERRLAKFLSHQQHAHRRGELAAVQRAQLASVPGLAAVLARWEAQDDDNSEDGSAAGGSYE